MKVKGQTYSPAYIKCTNAPSFEIWPHDSTTLTLKKAALRLAGSNPKLAIKIGRALIITHDYSGAIKYYKKSLKRGENFELRLEMADLLKKLKRVDEAESILLEGTEHSTRNEFYLNLIELNPGLNIAS